MLPRTVRISAGNHAFQHLDALRRKRETRHRHRQFFVEGVRPITQALAHGWPVEALGRYGNDALLASPPFIRIIGGKGVTVAQIQQTRDFLPAAVGPALYRTGTMCLGNRNRSRTRCGGRRS